MDMLQNLQTLPTVQPKQKLSTSGKHFTVRNVSGVLTSMWRSWYGEDRIGNVARLQRLFPIAMLRCEVLRLRQTNSAPRARIETAMQDGLPGLACLAQTYRDDVAIVSSLAVLTEDVRTFLQKNAEELQSQQGGDDDATKLHSTEI